MFVSELLEALEGVNPDARVMVYGHHIPRSSAPSDVAEGDIVQIVVSAVDGNDRLVVLSNCVETSAGELVFDAPPQFKRFSIGTADGVAAAAADLREQAYGERTVDLRTHLEVKRVKTMFRSFEELLRSSKEGA